MSVRDWRVLIVYIGLTILTSSAQAKDWYDGIAANCSGSDPALQAFTALLPQQTLVFGPGGSTYAVLDVGVANSSEEKVTQTLTLDPKKAADFKKALEVVVGNYNVPFVIEADGAILTGLLPPLAGVPAGLLFSTIVAKVNATMVDARSIPLFVAAGGQLQRRLKVVRGADKATYAASTSEYAVSLGSEKRRFVMGGCIYPTSVKVSEFDTPGPGGKKIMLKTPPKTWGVFDVDDNKWDSIVLTYTFQDQEYYYFDENAIENDKVVGTNVHRVSFQGGKWQVKNYDWQDFKSFTAGVTAK